MVFLMVFAAAYAVGQLAVLSLAARSLRTTTLLLVGVAGCYGCGLLAIGLEVAYTRLVQLVSGGSLSAAVRTAGYTVDPVIEELVKMLPLVAAVLVARRVGRSWGSTDHLLLGAATGAGFALAEALLRYTSRAGRAISDGQGGFILLTNLDPPHINGLFGTLAGWLPPPVDSIDLFGGPTGLNLHVVWTALAGLGIAFVLRLRGWRRLLGLVPLGYAVVDHVANNFAAAHPGTSGPGGALLDGLGGLRRALPVLVLLALAAATVLDVRVLRSVRRSRPELLLAGERAGRPSVAVLGRFALVAPPWTLDVALRFLLARRAVAYADGRSGPGEQRSATVADQLDRAADRARWRAVAGRRLALAGSPRTVLRSWRVLVWLVLLVPPTLYLVLGAVPRTVGLQRLLESRAVFPSVAVVSAAGLVYVGWQTVSLARHRLDLAARTWGEPVLRAGLRIAVGAAAVVAGAALVVSALTGRDGGDRVVLSSHILEALSSTLVAAALLLALASLIFFPPFALVALAEGGMVLVLTEAAATAAVGVGAATVLGTAGVMLSEVADGAGSGGSSSDPASGPAGGRNLDPATRAEVQQKLPEGWDAGRANKDGVGTRWFDPENPQGNGVRVDEGTPDSPWPSQQVDHVVVRHNGRVIGPDGRPIEGPLNANPQAHIPLSDWLRWTTWWGP